MTSQSTGRWSPPGYGAPSCWPSDWRHVDLDARTPSARVRAKGNRPRRHPLSPALAAELAALKQERRSSSLDDPVFCGLARRRPQPTVLAAIISRSARRAGIDKRVTAHTLRHTAATWLRQDTGDTRLVAEHLGHADLSTVARYTHVAATELHDAADRLGRRAGLAPPRRPEDVRCGQLSLQP